MSVERLRKFASGRCDRPTFWVSHLLIIWLGAISIRYAVSSVRNQDADAAFNVGLMASALIVLALAIAIPAPILFDLRRIHDRGKTGHWLVFVWIPVIAKWLLHDQANAIGSAGQVIVNLAFYLALAWYVIDLGFLPGEDGVNAYGPPLPPRRSRLKEGVAAGGSWEKFKVNEALDRIVADKLARDRARAATAEQPGKTDPGPPLPTSVPSVAPSRTHPRV